MKNILIIGNGFDLAHGLPTTYPNFLDICLSVMKHYAGIEIPDEYLKWADKKKASLFVNLLENEVYDQFLRSLKHNFWIEEFMSKRHILGEQWLNFEKEINQVVYLLVSDAQQAPSEIIKQVTNKTLQSFAREKGLFYHRTYSDLFIFLLDEYNRLIKALEIYMDAYVNKLQRERLGLFISKKFDYVLSFNYTCTYTETYDPSIECCYIHGKANLQNGLSNMILGFDDHYIESQKVIPEAIPFEKYYQRIVKGTDNQYLAWLEEANNPDSQTKVTIYGHSLAPSDGDVIRAFVTAQNTTTEIYYYNEFDRAEKIKNLALILGPHTLIDLAGGINPRITFTPNEA